MSDNKIQNEEELWSVLDGTAAPKAEPKPEPKPAKSEGKFAKADAPKGKVDGFFLTCMAGVAAVAVAATLLVSSMLGGNAPAVSGGAAAGGDTSAARIEELELENEELRKQIPGMGGLI